MKEYIQNYFYGMWQAIKHLFVRIGWQGYWGVPCKRWNGDAIEICEW